MNTRILTTAIITAATGLSLAAPALAEQAADDHADLESRLEAMLAELDERREAQHVPGFSIAIVKDGEVILETGRGLANVEDNVSADEHTVYAIGSTTKTMTAALVGIMVDQGLMSFDDPVAKHLPGVTLADTEVEMTIRDLLAHRTGLTRMPMTWALSVRPRDQVMAHIAQAEAYKPFRSEWQYNNVTYMAAGEAAAAAAGIDWETLLRANILDRLGMDSASVSLDEARTNDKLARGYTWNADNESFKHVPMRDLGAIAPSGSVNASVHDMTKWLHVMLDQGEYNGDTIIEPDTLEAMFEPQIDMPGGGSYALGFMVSDWNGTRLVQHGGNIDGFASTFAFLPDEGVGFTMLQNVIAAPLQQEAIDIVFSALLPQHDTEAAADADADADEMAETAADTPADAEGPYHFRPQDQVWTVGRAEGGALAIDIPGQMNFELADPDADGWRAFTVAPQIKLRFVTADSGETVGIQFNQGGITVPLPRVGRETEFNMTMVGPSPFTQDQLAEYIGSYRAEFLGGNVVIAERDGLLTADVPGQFAYDLRWPNDDGRWVFRETDLIELEFARDDAGKITALRMFQAGQTFELPRVEDTALPSMDELAALRSEHAASTAWPGLDQAIEMTGTIDFIHQGVSGTFRIVFDAQGRQRVELDLGTIGEIVSGIDAQGPWTLEPTTGLDRPTGKIAESAKLSQPAVFLRPLADTFDGLRVVRSAEHNGSPAFVVRARKTDLTDYTLTLDAETGAVVAANGTQILEVGNLPVSYTYSDYRSVGPVMLPFRTENETPSTGVSVSITEDAQLIDITPGLFSPPADARSRDRSREQGALPPRLQRDAPTIQPDARPAA